MRHPGPTAPVPAERAPAAAPPTAAAAVLDERWPAAMARRHRAVLLRQGNGSALLLAEQRPDTLLRQAVESRVRAPVAWQAADAAEVERRLAEADAAFRALDLVDAAEAADGTAPAPSGLRAADLSADRLARADGSPAVRLLDALLFDALREGASDIHIETRPDGAEIRLRLDGVLQPVRRIEGTALAEQMVSRLKVLAELDIGERRLPQDGRFQRRVAAGSCSAMGGAGAGGGVREVDFRLSIIPSVHGEDAVVRVLDRGAMAGEPGTPVVRLEALGFDAEMRRRLAALARAPHGMLLVTGPTGSGKTTTLYAALGEVDTRGHKVVTIEDPVEVQLPGVVQIPVNDRKGLTFARGLRSILRHDPDHVMVGEIRDAETAQIAVQAALTGHGVFTTVHANSAYDVIGRLMHMGLDLYNVSAALNAVLAQRLLRQWCSHCAVPAVADARHRTQLGARALALRTAPGCPHCHGTGYRGRRPVAELLPFDDALRDLVAARAPMSQIKRLAQERGMRTLRDAALDAVAAGHTGLDEVDRVCGDA